MKEFLLYLIISFTLLHCCMTIESESNDDAESRSSKNGPPPSLKTCCNVQNAFDPYKGICNNNEQPSETSGNLYLPFRNWPLLTLTRPTNAHPINCQDGGIAIMKTLHMDFKSARADIYSYPEDPYNRIYINNVIYGMDEYCIDSVTTIENESAEKPHFTLNVFVCIRNCSVDNPCIKKCCDLSHNLNSNLFCEYNKTNVRSNTLLKLLSTIEGNTKDEVNSSNWSTSTIITSEERLQSRFLVNENYNDNLLPCKPKWSNEIKLLRNGNVELTYDVVSKLELVNYCVEIYKGKLYAQYCPSEVVEIAGLHLKLQLAYCCISTFFILLTLVAYLLVRKIHGINGWMQFAFIVSTFGYFAMRIARRSYDLIENLHPSSTVPDRVDTFFTIGMFVNLVNLNFHMFYTFWNITPPESGIKSAGQLKQLFITVSSCWIVAAVCVLFEFILDIDKKNLVTKIQMYILLGLLVLNMVIAIATGIVIWKQLMNRKKLTSTLASVNLKVMLKLYIKLFCFTGMVWSLKMLEMLRKTSFQGGWFWSSVQFVTYTYGFVIFIVFVVTNEKIIKALQEKFPFLKSKPDEANQTLRSTNNGYSSIDDTTKTSTN